MHYQSMHWKQIKTKAYVRTVNRFLTPGATSKTFVNKKIMMSLANFEENLVFISENRGRPKLAASSFKMRFVDLRHRRRKRLM